MYTGRPSYKAKRYYVSTSVSQESLDNGSHIREAVAAMHGRGMYLVCLVVVLGVVLEEGLLLGVVPDRHRLVELGLFPPVFAVDEPIFWVVGQLAVPLHRYGVMDVVALTSSLTG